MLLPSVVHASSTFESGAPQSYCVALFANSPFSTFLEPHECYCLALFMGPPFLSLELCFMIAEVRTLKAILHSHPFSEPHECYCLGLFMCPPLSSFELCFMIA